MDKAHDVAFKVVFSKKHLVMKKDYVPEDENSDDQDGAEAEEEDRSGRTKMQGG